jgi:hypothetical protein
MKVRSAFPLALVAGQLGFAYRELRTIPGELGNNCVVRHARRGWKEPAELGGSRDDVP